MCCFCSFFISSFFFLPALWFSYANRVKQPNFSRLYCTEMSRCHLTVKLTAALKVDFMGFPFKHWCLDFVCIVCMSGWLCMCVHACLLSHVHVFNLKQYRSCILFAQSTKSWHLLLIFLRLSYLACLALTRSSPRWKKEPKKPANWKMNHPKLCLNLAALLLTDRP